MSCLADGPKLVSKEKRNCVVQDCILNILIEKSVHGGAKHLEHCHVLRNSAKPDRKLGFVSTVKMRFLLLGRVAMLADIKLFDI